MPGRRVRSINAQVYRRRATLAFGLAAACAALAPATSSAADTVVTGILGSYTAGVWPFLIAMKKGMLERRGIAPDIVFVPTAPGLVQQLAAGSLDIVAVNGLAEPLHAVERGAPVAIMRIIGQNTNYVMVGGRNIPDIKSLRGKKIAIGGLRDINKIYLDRVMRPNGLTDQDFDIIVIGATGARFAALQSGAIDATMLVPPYNFMAAKQGLHILGQVSDYAKDLPQTSMQVASRWANSHMPQARAINDAIDEAVAWFYTAEHRDEAIDMLAQASKTNRAEVAESYDFLVRIDAFAHTSAIRTQPLNAMMHDMVAMKDITRPIAVDALVIKGLNQITE